MNHYNALDIEKMAKELREQLVLERDDINASISYEMATSWCDDCPHSRGLREPESYSELYFGMHYAEECCKDSEDWNLSTLDQVRKIDELIKVIGDYLGEGKNEPQSG